MKKSSLITISWILFGVFLQQFNYYNPFYEYKREAAMNELNSLKIPNELRISSKGITSKGSNVDGAIHLEIREKNLIEKYSQYFDEELQRKGWVVESWHINPQTKGVIGDYFKEKWKITLEINGGSSEWTWINLFIEEKKSDAE